VIRREFLGLAAGSSFGIAARASGQSPQMGPMEQDAYRPVRLAAKPGARPSMTPEERDAFETRIGCRCGCTLSVYICRTTDFSCQVSPAMHRDVIALIEGGHSAQEIIDAFTGVYGEKVLLAPPRRGFNLVGYVLPFAVMLGGLVLVASVVRRMRARPAVASTGPAPADATPEELDRIAAAMRDDS
jgi:cytochrome c-type biogenesis protein CcmH